MRLRVRIATALAVLTALAAPAAAHASGSAVIKDCADGSLSRTYSQKDYADALAHMPADVDEYTDCRAMIRRAQLGGSSSGGTGGPGGSGGGGFGGFGGGSGGGDDGTGGPAVDPLATASPAERASYAKAVKAASAPVVLDGRRITPGQLGGTSVHGLNDLPTPLLVVLALLAAGGLGGAGLGTHRLVIGRRAA